MSDRAQALREFVKTLDPKEFKPGLIEIAPPIPESFEDYQLRLSFWRMSKELAVKS